MFDFKPVSFHFVPPPTWKEEIKTMKPINTEDLSKHPLTVLKEIGEKWNVESFRFRTYVGSEYGSGWRDVETYRVKTEELLTLGLDIIEEAEAEGYDVAVESAVTLKPDENATQAEKDFPENRKSLHIPMIDFIVPIAGPEFAEDEAIGLQQVIDAMAGVKGAQTVEGAFETVTNVDLSSLRFFHSGRSLHAYGVGGLMSEERWRKFMAELLIINPVPASADPDDAKLDLVDARWVGRRLIQGSGSLRLTAVDEKYLQVPELVTGYTLPVSVTEPF